MKTFKNYSILITLILISDLFAVGGLFVKPRFSDQEYQKMWIKSVNVQVQINDQIAVTHVDQVFFNEMNTSVEGIYIFPLPENAVITELVYWVNGQRYVASVREKEEAVAAYNKKLRQWLDPALLEYLGDNLFRLSIVPIDALTEVRTEITYAELLDYDIGKIAYKFLLNTLDLSSKPLNSVKVNIDANSQNSFKFFESPTHGNSTATNITKLSDKHYTLFFGDENFSPVKDLIISYETYRSDVQMTALTYTPVPADSFGNDSFYIIWITPPDELDQEDIIPQDIVFTIDVSSSMEGKRILQVKEALNAFLDHLNPADRFNIVTFGTFIKSFKSDLVPVSDQNITDARYFISQIYALGLTNIDEALSVSLNQSYRDTTSNNLVFLTDGEPTWGEKDINKILENVSQNNTKNVRLFSFGVGDELNRQLLTELALENHGFSTYISSEDSIAYFVDKHFLRISKPVLTDLEINIPGLNTWDRYPKIIHDLFWGSQVNQLGLYQNSGEFDVTLKGKKRSESFEYTKTIWFPDTSGGNRFVPRLWAQAKINNILDLIDIYGETDELVDQIIELSLTFQILTPYTAFYIDPDDPTTDIDKNENIIVEEFKLYQNFPNPFNPQTIIRYDLPANKSSYHVIIEIFDMLGRRIAILINDQQKPGQYSVKWDGRDLHGNLVPSGIYIYRIKAGSFTQSQKMILVR